MPPAASGSSTAGAVKLRCSRCKRHKPEDAFPRNRTRKRGRSYYCKPCLAKSTMAWQKANPDKTNEYRRNWARKALREVRDAIFDALGQHKCQRCGYDEDDRVLQIDHVDRAQGGGRAEQKAAGNKGLGYYKYILARILAGHAEDYQILCSNCNLLAWYDHLGVPCRTTTKRKR